MNLVIKESSTIADKAYEKGKQHFRFFYMGGGHITIEQDNAITSVNFQEERIIVEDVIRVPWFSTHFHEIYIDKDKVDKFFKKMYKN